MKMAPQSVLTMPLLVGLDGTRKMSKSYDNYIAFNDTSKDIFGKIMSISDDSMMEFYRLLLGSSEKDISELKNQHPMEAKKKLAFELTARFYDLDTAQKELDEFSSVFSKGMTPDEMPSFSMKQLNLEKYSMLNILASTGLFESKGQIRRLIIQGGVKLNGERLDEPESLVPSKAGMHDQIIKAGKKIFIKLTE
jgi:tyrosyl-tRNA synthetase